MRQNGVVTDQHPIITSDPCTECAFRERCAAGMACPAFANWCETGNADGMRAPSREIFAKLYVPILTVEQLRRQWRREGAVRSSAVQRGLKRRLTRKEQGLRYRRHLWQIWELDPTRRAFELERKRLDAQRRERARGRTPISPEKAAARSRLAWQRRRERAAAEGLVMTAEDLRELRRRLGMTQRELAVAIGSARTNIEHYETGDAQAPPGVVRALKELVRGQEKVPAPPGSFEERAAPAASGYSQAQPL